METNNKLREALMHIQNLADALDLDEPNVIAILDTCRDALAEPVRNCEVGTVEEQFKRHSKWCATTKDFSCAPMMCRKCFANWAQMPYEEGGAK